MKTILKYIGLALVIVAISMLAGMAVGYSLHGTVFWSATIVDEMENVDIFEDQACTVPATSFAMGEIPRDGQLSESVWLWNRSQTRATLVRGVIEPDPDFPEMFPDWYEPLGIVMAPTSRTLLAGQVAEFQIGVTVPIDADKEDIRWQTRFFTDDDLPPPAGLIYIPGSDARIDWIEW